VQNRQTTFHHLTIPKKKRGGKVPRGAGRRSERLLRAIRGSNARGLRLPKRTNVESNTEKKDRGVAKHNEEGLQALKKKGRPGPSLLKLPRTTLRWGRRGERASVGESGKTSTTRNGWRLEGASCAFPEEWRLVITGRLTQAAAEPGDTWRKKKARETLRIRVMEREGKEGEYMRGSVWPEVRADPCEQSFKGDDKDSAPPGRAPRPNQKENQESPLIYSDSVETPPLKEQLDEKKKGENHRRSTLGGTLPDGEWDFR